MSSQETSAAAAVRGMAACCHRRPLQQLQWEEWLHASQETSAAAVSLECLLDYSLDQSVASGLP